VFHLVPFFRIKASVDALQFQCLHEPERFVEPFGNQVVKSFEQLLERKAPNVALDAPESVIVDMEHWAGHASIVSLCDNSVFMAIPRKAVLATLLSGAIRWPCGARRRAFSEPESPIFVLFGLEEITR
jgi:hypothetical protein